MKKSKIGVISLIFVFWFILWTILIAIIDVNAIGPNGSKVGFSVLNKFVHNFFGVNYALYIITDWLGLIPVAVCLGFAFLGAIQWIKRKRILKVDKDILLLGVFYVVVFGVYMLFEYLVINYRPVLINGYLEASYPSSTTMLTICVMPTALITLNKRIKNKIIKNTVNYIIWAFIVFMVLGRLISGVHWFTDIIGGLILSIGLVLGYSYLVKE